MVRQVGDGLVTENDLALRGIIIRHLVLPQMVENSFQVLQTIRKSLSTAIPLSIMSQYTPARPMENHPVLGRRVTKDEYEQVVNEAIDLGFEYLFVQEVDDDHRLPDFEKDQPFRWE
jgi:putative pyruvate formate lyase activating enzyme